MQDRPTAGELLEALREFVERDLLPELDGRRRFHARVAANVLGILEREWAGEEAALEAEWRRLAALLGLPDDEPPRSLSDLREAVRTKNAELCELIRSGAMDDRWDETVDAVRASVVDKLAIANPRWLSSDDAPG